LEQAHGSIECCYSTVTRRACIHSSCISCDGRNGDAVLLGAAPPHLRFIMRDDACCMLTSCIACIASIHQTLQLLVLLLLVTLLLLL
jgi:hypothetical protein